ncbi:transmembrane protease serine 9-like isoform X2 [Wyeomyia smithii]|uniref:transmembrane protease serine 9-like isoform X2 n=1 Tax=Wyeomyia smithii TaxID=174621 RepID=UPI002467B24F|nr:transmembrane protease serine 9-like isoform X2 [Wyeomyia smithii]
MKLFTIAIVLVLEIISWSNDAASCGQKKAIAQQFIAFGYRALAGSWPWHGAMFVRVPKSSSYACGVTVLTEQFVITAAHCTIDPTERQRLPPSRVFVKLGVTNLDASEKHAQQHNVDIIIRHEGYDDISFEDDVALMKLYTEITYSSHVQPICLWQGDKSLNKIVAKIGYIAGWGLDENYGLPKDLNEATMPIVSKQDCLDSDYDHYSKVFHDKKTFCAGYRNGTAAGPGDSGGGMFLRVGNSWVLRGIVSNGKTDPNTLKIISTSYLVLMDAAYYIDWIRSHVTIETTIETDAEPIETPAASTSSGDQANLLDVSQCGKEKYPLGTPEEFKGSLGQYPWLAVIEFVNLNTRFLEDVCHGILIHPRFMLTAAHCVQRRRLATLRSVRLNDYRLDTVTDIFEVEGKTVKTTAVRIPIKGVSVHPSYDTPKFANNIALIQLDQSTALTPICLPTKGTPVPANKLLSIVGWKKHSRPEKYLIRNVVQLADFQSCKRKYADTNVALDTSGGQICSTYNHDDNDENCSHYMGAAPFQYVRNGPFEGRYFLAAISSFGHSDCRREEYSDVFTNVGHYSDWIRDKLKQNE